MKTIAIQFRENSKIYNFNTTDESIKAGDFVLIYTQEQFKIVLVVEDNLEFEENHAQILGKLNDNLPVLKFKLVHEVDTSAVEYDLNLKFQTLDVEIENKETILKAS